MTRKPTRTTEPTLPINLPQTPAEYLDILRFRWYWALIGIVLGAIVSQIVVRQVPERFKSRTVVLVESDPIPSNFLPTIATEEARDRLRTIHEEILARPRIERVMEELDPYPEMIDVPRADVVDMIRSRTAIGLRGRDAFVVEYEDTDPERAQQMATRLASLFIEETSGDRRRQVQGANEFIDSQLQDTKRELEQVEGELSSLKRRYMGMLPGQLDANLATLQRLQLERQSLSDEIRSAKDRLSLLERQRALQSQMDEPEAQLIPTVPSAGSESSTQPSSLGQLEAYLAQLRTRYTDAHPEVVAVQARIERMKKQLAETGPLEVPAEESVEEDTAPTPETNDILVSDLSAQIAATARDIEELEARSALVQQDIARYQARVEKIPEVENELQTLERDYALISDYYGQLLARKLEAETAGDVEKQWNEEQFKVLDPAQVPEKASYPDPKLFLLTGVLIGLGAGLALGFVLEVLDSSVKSKRQLEALLPYPIVLTLPAFKQPKRHRRRGDSDPAPPTQPPSTRTTESEELSAAS